MSEVPLYTGGQGGGGGGDGRAAGRGDRGDGQPHWPLLLRRDGSGGARLYIYILYIIFT